MNYNRIPQVILGSSPFVSSTQFKDKAEDYKKRLYNNWENIYEIMKLSVECGCGGIHCISEKNVIKACEEVRKISRNIFIIATIGFGLKVQEQLEAVMPLRPDAFLLHSSLVDNLEDKYSIKVSKALKKYTGLIGFSTYKSVQKMKLLERGEFDFAMIPLNKIGYNMTYGQEELRRILGRNIKTIIGMQIMASGRIAPEEGIEWASGYVKNMVVGIGNPEHIKSTMDCLFRYIRQ